MSTVSGKSEGGALNAVVYDPLGASQMDGLLEADCGSDAATCIELCREKQTHSEKGVLQHRAINSDTTERTT